MVPEQYNSIYFIAILFNNKSQGVSSHESLDDYKWLQLIRYWRREV